MTTPQHSANTLMNQEQAAALLGLSPRTLEQWRLKGGGPAFVRMSHRCVRYRREALDAWLMAREVTSTSAPRLAA